MNLVEWLFVWMVETREQRLTRYAAELAKTLPIGIDDTRALLESYGSVDAVRAAAQVAAASGYVYWPPTRREVDEMIERARQRALSYG